MRGSAKFGFLLACLLTALPAFAGITGVTGDGTWDCRADDGTDLGAVVVVDTAYAHLKPDGTLNAYGKLYIMTEDVDLPHYIVVSGPLKDEFSIQAASLQGPADHPHALDGELFLALVADPEHIIYCTRRMPAKA